MSKRVVEIYGGGAVGGAAQHLRLLCRGLVERGWEVRFLSLPPHALASDMAALGIPTEQAAGPGAAVQTLRRLAPDVLLHAHGTRALGVALASRRPFVRTVHSFIHQDYRSAVRRLPALVLDRRSFTAARRIITVSEALRTDLVRRGCSPMRLVTVPNGVAPPPPPKERAEVLAEFGWEEAAPLIVMAARLDPLKGVDRALAALAELPRARLVVFGEGRLRTRLEEEARALGVHGRVVLAGYRREARAYLGAADVVLMPSRQEGLPLVAVEALAAGVPVVASDLPGLREALGDVGIYVEGTPRAIAAGVEQALKERAERSLRAKDRFAAVFSLERFLDATEAVLSAAAP